MRDQKSIKSLVIHYSGVIMSSKHHCKCNCSVLYQAASESESLRKDALIGSASNHNTITPSSRDTENVLVHKYKLNHLERSPGTERPTINGNVYLTNLSPGGFNRMDSSDYGLWRRLQDAAVRTRRALEENFEYEIKR
ncbi:unnamed protein product [Euphydryas editha]|uniref:Uncharacterized protein n=1 Tax=Euphydryas editha TaxID=104508 RepID=A0AAU9TX77_EUPED|nr:unnamed protein product [Euphydryas editha]